MTKKWARAALTHPAFCGVSRAHFGGVIEELADLWLARRESELRERGGAERQREAGAGPKHDLVFTDRLVVTLVHLRTGLPHAALAELYGIARFTISRAIGEIRPLLAVRGFAVPDHSGVRLRTLADVFAYAEAAGIRLRIDGAETQVRRPKAGRPGRRAFVSGKKKQNTSRAPSSCSPGRLPSDQPPADPPGQHGHTSIADQVVRSLTGSSVQAGVTCGSDWSADLREAFRFVPQVRNSLNDLVHGRRSGIASRTPCPG
ncbi:transposase family protein [Streptomyces sp. NPDC058467]|uniref:helix-turn-helix domain-containing protein n=1 Tax=Streptomyces sp. NPDC058467 TaxID=3346513 RepID=UPI003667882C